MVRRGVILPTTWLTVQPHGGEDDHTMYWAYLDESHEMGPPYRLTFAEGVYAIAHTAVHYRSVVAFDSSSTAQNVACGCAVP